MPTTAPETMRPNALHDDDEALEELLSSVQRTMWQAGADRPFEASQNGSGRGSDASSRTSNRRSARSA